MGSEPPRVEFALPGGERGFDYAEEVRLMPVSPGRRRAAR